MLRAMAVALARGALRFLSSRLPVRSMGSALVVAPHPDDEALGCGGTVALLSDNGVVVNLIVVTDGSASHPNHPAVPPERLASIRRAEALAVAGRLGISPDNVFFAGARDGTLSLLSAREATRLAEAISSEIRRTRPGSILLPFRRDRSDDHEATFVLVTRALALSSAKARVLEFPIWAWRNPISLVAAAFAARAVWSVDISSVLARKAGAIGTYASQVRPIPPDSSPILSSRFLSNFVVTEEYFLEQ
jgi:LmbE family N-acetylglucosaminyl deacetylase